MGIKRHPPEEIVTKLRQVEVLVGQGMVRIELPDNLVHLMWEYLSLLHDGWLIDWGVFYSSSNRCRGPVIVQSCPIKSST